MRSFIKIIIVLAFFLPVIVGCDQCAEQPIQSKTEPPSSAEHKQSEVKPNEFIVESPLKGLLKSENEGPFFGDFSEMKRKRSIRALVTYSKTDFFIHNGQIKGLQAELLQAYEDEINEGIKKESEKIRITYIPVTFDQLIPALQAGYGDIAAALLTKTPERLEKVDFTSNEKADVSEVLVRNKSAAPISSLEGLSGKTVYVLRNSSYAEHLRGFNERLPQGLPPVDVVEAESKLLSEDILEIVNAGIFNYTIVDDYKAELWAGVLPQLQIERAVRLTEGNSVGWAIRKNTPQLQKSLNRFIAKRVKKGSLLGNILIKRYLISEKWITNPLLHTDKDRLVRLMPLFTKYAEKYQLDPIALAAQAFQESGLKQATKSHRGAVGVMQLLPSTASDKNVAIEQIDDIEHNIHAGAKYMAFLRKRYVSDDNVSALDQMLLSLAAYNAGPGNLRKMRKLADEMGLDRNQWFGNVELAAAKIIGNETVQYVSNIYKYYTAYNLSKSLYTERVQLLDKVIN
ncbi:lytic transglycosylase F [Neptuniibacter sp.]|uniref:transglycosylase SLT domain-containing protein n=1 Tax=Neptuniibacter sp. TaxID=1962643 RepID=UPI00262326E2|nr:lytic transglycosylase F [Neptuniibacter sp.]MCP4595351.1 lytic transglycosylase F [Neptuniibacter sp.]